ncbi:MAG TPA: hypothetical protein VGK20_05105 [Candidatus Binatia bacterium]|jgi:hypothetical protein
MPTVTLKAHYDGSRILLDEPFEIPADSPLMVTVLPVAGGAMDQDALSLATRALSRAYGDDEPDYSGADVSR